MLTLFRKIDLDSFYLLNVNNNIKLCKISEYNFFNKVVVDFYEYDLHKLCFIKTNETIITKMLQLTKININEYKIIFSNECDIIDVYGDFDYSKHMKTTRGFDFETRTLITYYSLFNYAYYIKRYQVYFSKTVYIIPQKIIIIPIKNTKDIKTFIRYIKMKKLFKYELLYNK